MGALQGESLSFDTESSFDIESSLDTEVSGPKGRTKCRTKCGTEGQDEVQDEPAIPDQILLPVDLSKT